MTLAYTVLTQTKEHFTVVCPDKQVSSLHYELVMVAQVILYYQQWNTCYLISDVSEECLGFFFAHSLK